MTQAGFTIGIDTGGTFTDIALLYPTGEIVTGKSATTPSDFSVGVINALGEIARQLAMPVPALLAQTRVFKHGTTVATNALITRSGSDVGLLTTRGFEGTPTIMRAIGRVDGLPSELVKHVSNVTKPAPLVPATRVRGVRERIDYRGEVVVPLRLDDVDAAIDDLLAAGCDAIAVSLMHAWRNPVHEAAIKARVAERGADATVYWSFGSDLSRVVGEYARTNTALANCYIGPTVTRYLADLERKLRELGFLGTFLVMQGNGGAVGLQSSVPIGSLQSGPAAGLIASAYMANHLEHTKVLTADMGGTSLDVSLLTDGLWRYADEPVFERFRILQPISEIESIGAGGGTIARVDPSSGRLVVGPESAGASPGPVCYCQGGTAVTVTDVDVVLGYIDPDHFLGGRQRLDRTAAEAAIARTIAEPLGLSVIDAAAGVFEIINNKMADLIRTQIVRGGHLPNEYALYSFGGAGPVHAVAFARELGIREIVIFPTSAVFSAFGAATADIVHTRVTTFEAVMPLPPDELNRTLEAIESELTQLMRQEGLPDSVVTLRRIATMRYRRQTHGVEVEVPAGRLDAAAMERLIAAFDEKYAQTYGVGSGFAQAGVELSTLRIDAIGALPKPTLSLAAAGDEGSPLRGEREVWFDGRFCATPIYEYARMAPGLTLNGPAIVETALTTIVVPPGWHATVDGALNISIRKGLGEPR